MVRQHSDSHAVYRADDDTNSNGYTNSNTYPYAYPNPHTNSNTYPYAYPNPHTNSNSNTHTNSKSKSNAPFRHTDTGTHHDTYPER
jgi:hypothetical protein